MRGLFGTLARAEAKSDTSNTVYGSIEDMWRGIWGAVPSRAGPTVSWQTSLNVTTVLACARRIAEGLATVPLKVYRRKPDGKGREEAREHPLYDLLFTQPNDWGQTSVEFREVLAFHVVLTGNAFVFKNRVRGRIVELLIIEPGRVAVRRQNDYSLTYVVTGRDGSQEVMTSDQIWHIRGPSWDSVNGVDIVKVAREAIGLAIATEQTHAEFHRNGARLSGVISVDGALREDQLVRLAAWVRRHFAGAENTGKVMPIDRAAKFSPLQMTGVDAQHLETRRFQLEEICRVLCVLPVMVGSYDKSATYASSEQMFLAHLVHTVRPWHRRFEASMDVHLLTADERKDGYYTGFIDTEFLRAAAKDRAEFYKIALGGAANPGWLTPDDVRGYEDLNPVPGGNHLYMPTTLAPIGPDGKPMTPPAASPPAGA